MTRPDPITTDHSYLHACRAWDCPTTRGSAARVTAKGEGPGPVRLPGHGEERGTDCGRHLYSCHGRT
ncbi:hypothetical protein BJX96DRAFT_154790 [Aspergillus floccosus]